MAQSFALNDALKAKEYFQNKLSFTTGPVEVSAALKRGESLNIVDVRSAEDFTKEHIVGAVHLPESLWETCEGLSHDKLNVIYCYSHVCHLAARAAAIFAGSGYSVMELDGGFKSWKEHNLETEGDSAQIQTSQKPTIADFTAARMSSHH